MGVIDQEECGRALSSLYNQAMAIRNIRQLCLHTQWVRKRERQEWRREEKKAREEVGKEKREKREG